MTDVAVEEARVDESTWFANLMTESANGRGDLATSSGGDSERISKFAASQFSEICLLRAASECGSWATGRPQRDCASWAGRQYSSLDLSLDLSKLSAGSTGAS